jgi:chromosome segregation ATPase
MPLLELNLLKELRKQKVQGVYGFLIEFVDIDPEVAFAYEIAGLNKLCTLLVED